MPVKESLSTGHTEVDLNPATLIVGKRSSKSTILDALTFSLFAKQVT